MAESKRAPCLFIAHGNPMNALADNDYTRAIRSLGKSLSRPSAILCVSAHFQTRGSFVTAMAHPRTIHDFFGFPKNLFEVQYPAAGSPELAKEVSEICSDIPVVLDFEQWGLDHGAWSVLVHLYPEANVPVVMLSLDLTKPPEFHFELGKKLNKLREQNVMILGSGNIVHNLGAITWSSNNPHGDNFSFDKWVTDQLNTKNYLALVKDFLSAPGGKWSNPTLDHYLPLLYVLGASNNDDTYHTIFEGYELGSISMRSVGFW